MPGIEPGTSRVREVLAEAPLSDAERVTVCEKVTEPAVAVKVMLFVPGETATEEGITTAAESLDSTTVKPSGGATPVSVSVQVELSGVITADGVQTKLLGVIGGGCQSCTARALSKPATPVAVPSGNTPIVVLTAIGTEALLVDAASVAVTTATISLAMVVEFMPTARQVKDPFAALQLMVLSAALRASPGSILKETMSPGA